MKRIILINALIWAGLILTASYLFKDVPNYNYFFIAMVGCAGFSNALLSSQLARKKKCS